MLVSSPLITLFLGNKSDSGPEVTDGGTMILYPVVGELCIIIAGIPKVKNQANLTVFGSWSEASGT